MKKLLIGLGVVVLILGASITYLFLNAEQLVNSYKPELEKLASKAIQTPVKLGDVSLAFFPTAKVSFDSLTLGQETTSKPLSLNTISFAVQVLPLLSGNLKIDSISLEDPIITVVKKGGDISIVGLPKKKAPNSGARTQRTETAAASARQESDNSKNQTVPIEVNLQSFLLNGGQILFDDQDTKQMYRMDDLAIDATLSVRGADVHSKTANISADVLGEIPVELTLNDLTFNIATGDLKISPANLAVFGSVFKQVVSMNTQSQKGEIQSDVESLDLKRLIAGVRKAGITVPVQATGKVSSNATISLKGSGKMVLRDELSLEDIALQKDAYAISKLSGTVLTTGTPPRFGAEPDISFHLNETPMTFSATMKTDAQQHAIPSAQLKAFGGTIEAKARIQKNPRQQIELSLRGGNLDLQPIGKTFLADSSMSFSGIVKSIHATIDASIRDGIKETAKGSGDFTAVDGKILGINIARATLEALKLPFLEGGIYAAIPEGFKEYVNADDTIVKELTSAWSIREQTIDLQKFLMHSSFYSIRGQGTTSLTGAVNLRASLQFSEEFSEKFAAKTKEAKYLLNREGHIVIPLAIRGTAPKLIITPDMEEVLKLQAGKAIEEKATKAIDKLLGDKTGNTGESLKRILGF